MDELVGRSFGPYTIMEKIGEGGMSIVYKGYQESLNRYVAIKVLRSELAHDEEFITRFRREALAVAKLSHSNILHVYDAGEAHGVYYIVMDYVAGGSLKDLIAKGPFEMERAVSIAIQLADALDHAHEEQVIHRDVKPSNVLLARDGRPLLTDFGIARAFYESARLTRTGTSIGTPEYMSPEQAHGQPADARADIYALGIVLFEMLTGWVPFSAPTPVATLYKHVNDPPPPLRQANADIPSWLEAATNKALAKDPDNRYQRAGDFAEQLRQRRAPHKVSTHLLPRKKTPTPARGLTGAEKRRAKNPVPLLLGAIGVILLALVTGGAYLLLGGIGSDADVKVSPTLVVLATSAAPTQTLVPTYTSTNTAAPSPTVEPETSTPVIIIITNTREPLPTAAEASATPLPTTAPTLTPQPTSTPEKTPVPSSRPGVIADFETFGTWKRGDEPNGTFTQSNAQVHQGSYSGKLTYSFGTSENDYVVFIHPRSIGGQPTRITAWVYGDGSGHLLNVWIREKGGQVWQVPLGRITHSGWQQMKGALDVNQEWPWAHIDGPNNGRIDYPVSFYALILDDNPDPYTGNGTMYIDELRADAEVVAVPGGGGGEKRNPTATSEAVAPAPPTGRLDGNIVFTVYNAGIGSYTLYRVNPDGSDLHALADYVHQPDISPNGKYIVVDGIGGGKDDLWSFKLDGSDWRHLTQHPDDHFPTWSPNDLVIAFSSSRQGDGVGRLYMDDAPISTDKTEFIIGDYPVLLPTWEVVFSGCDYGWGTGANCGLWRASKGHAPAQITGTPQDIPTDGTTDEVLFLRPDGDNWDIYRLPRTGGNPVRLTDSPGRDGPATYSPDGKTIAFLSDRSGTWALYTMNRQGGDTRKRLDLPMGANYDQAPLPWSSERISWGPSPVGPTPMPTEDTSVLPAPQITFPIPDDTFSVSKPTVVKWTWSQQLAFNQGFEVRFWHTSESAPSGIAPATAETQLEVSFGLTRAYLKYGQSFYYLDVVVVQLNPYKVLSKSARIRVKADPNK